MVGAVPANRSTCAADGAVHEGGPQDLPCGARLQPLPPHQVADRARAQMQQPGENPADEPADRSVLELDGKG